MSNVKRYGRFVQTGVELEDAFLSDCENGDWVKFTDYEAKCADYERLRDALEKIVDEWQFVDKAILKFPEFVRVSTVFAGQEIRDMRAVVRQGRDALTPAAGQKGQRK